MESLIKLLIKQDYDNFEKILCSSKELEKNNILKLFYFFIKMFHLKIFDDKSMFVATFLFFKYKIDFLDIDTPKDILEKIKNDKFYKLTYELLDYYSSLNSTKEYLFTFINTIRISDCTVKKLIKEDITTEELYKIILREVKPTIISFSESRFVESLKLHDSIFRIKNIDKRLWENTHAIEMHNRLAQVVIFLGIDLLSLMNIKLITNIQFSEFNYDEKVDYYKWCLNSIN